MTNYPIVQFVDSPSTTATVRLDLNDGVVSNVADPYSLGAPPVLADDPEAIAEQWGYRRLSFSVRISTYGFQKSIALARQTALARELARRNNWLLFQFSATSAPVWFRTFRTSPGEVSLSNVWSDDQGQDVWEIAVQVDAEPFAYGAKETISVGALSMNPTFGCWYAMPTIKGDAPAPLSLSSQWSSVQSGYRHLVACSALDWGMSAPILWQIGGSTDTWTAGVGTGASVTNSAYSSNSYREVDFTADPSMQPRLSGVTPAIRPGRYKVMLRAGFTIANSNFAFRAGVRVGGSYAYNQPISTSWAITTPTHFAWIDLGQLSFPAGTPMLDTVETAVQSDIAIDIQRTTSGGKVRMDALLLIPTNLASSMAFVDYVGLGPGVGQSEIIDSEEEVVYLRESSGLLAAVQSPAVIGDFLRVQPGKQNYLHVLEQASLSRASTSASGTSVDVPDRISVAAGGITDTATITATYYPRYLYLGAA